MGGLLARFELKFFVCRHVSMWGFRNRVCLSVRTTRKEITLASSISVLHLVITTLKSKNLFVLSKKFEIEFWLVFWHVLKSWNHLSFVNISPTLVIDTSMDRSARVLYHEKSKIWFYKKNAWVFLLSCFVNTMGWGEYCKYFATLPLLCNKHCVCVFTSLYSNHPNIGTFVFLRLKMH